MINISFKYSHKYGTRMSTDSRNWTKVKLNINFTKPTKINKIFRTDGYRGAN